MSSRSRAGPTECPPRIVGAGHDNRVADVLVQLVHQLGAECDLAPQLWPSAACDRRPHRTAFRLQLDDLHRPPVDRGVVVADARERANIGIGRQSSRALVVGMLVGEVADHRVPAHAVAGGIRSDMVQAGTDDHGGDRSSDGCCDTRQRSASRHAARGPAALEREARPRGCRSGKSGTLDGHDQLRRRGDRVDSAAAGATPCRAPGGL